MYLVDEDEDIVLLCVTLARLAGVGWWRNAKVEVMFGHLVPRVLVRASVVG
jgi:hypothetical protein